MDATDHSLVAALLGPDRSTHAALQWAVRRRLAVPQLTALIEVLNWRYPSIAEQCGAAFQVLRRSSIDLLSEVIGSPSGLLWLETLRECLEATDGEPASDYITAVEAASEHGEQLCQAVANRLWVFAAATTLRIPVTSISHPPMHVHGPVAFPTTGLVATAYAFTIKNVGMGVGAVLGSPLEKLPSVKVGSISVEVAAADRILASGCFEPTAKLVEPDDVAAFAKDLEAALRLLLRISPRHEPEIAASLRCAVPIATITPSVFRSGTPSRALGLSYLTATESPCHLIDMVVHEAAHNHLFLFQESEDPLLCPEAHEDGWGAPFVYSPWRDDPRPLNGLLHGCYVFWCVARFWLDACSSDAVDEDVQLFALRRLSALVAQIEAGMEELRAEAHWTLLGGQFFRCFSDEVSKLSDAARTAGAETARPTYVSDDVMSFGAMSGTERQRLHRERWLALHRS